MNVAELREILADLPGTLPVWTAIDPEGNGFNEIRDYETVVIDTEGETYYASWDADENTPEQIDEALREGWAVEVLRLWP